jgi:4-hydroxy-2-oxoheptanedioate aldolase
MSNSRSSIKTGIREGGFFFGCFSNMASYVPVQIAAYTGYHFVMLDHEHSPASLENAVQCINAAQGSGAEVWVRVPANDQAYIKRILDSGADGVMCPMVNSAEDARQLVSYCRFPPDGVRGVAPNLCRHTVYGINRDSYMANYERNVSIMAQIETRDAVENINAIVATEGLELFFIGPFDLSADLGVAGKFDHPDMIAAVSKVEAAVRKAGKFLATILLPGQSVSDLRARGYSFIIAGSDVALMRGALLDQYNRLVQATSFQPQ